MKKVLPLCVFSLAAAVLIASALACCRATRQESPEPDAEKMIKPEPVGKCREPDLIKGTCTFLSMHELSADHSLKPAGKSAFGVSYSLKAEDGSVTGVDIYLAASNINEDRLLEYYKEHSPVACELHKFYPPCAPVGEAAELKLDPPDFAELINPLDP
jgi:hypothetical protein